MYLYELLPVMNYAELKLWQTEPVTQANQVEGCFIKAEKIQRIDACLITLERYRCNLGSHTGVSSAQQTHLSWEEEKVDSPLELPHIILLHSSHCRH